MTDAGVTEYVYNRTDKAWNSSITANPKEGEIRMQPSTKRLIRQVVRTAILWLIALLISRNYEALVPPDSVWSSGAGLLHTMIRLVVVGAWACSISWRVTSPQVKRLLVSIAGLLFLWMLLRTARYYFVEEGLIKRLLWYGYYIPMMLIPPIALLAALAIGRKDDYRTPKKLDVLVIVGAILALVVLTNEFHQWVFRWDNPLVRTDETVHYSTLFYLLIIWEYGCGIIGFVVIAWRSRVPETRKRLWLPMILFLVLALFSLMYILKVPLIRYVFYDLTSFIVVLYIALFECLIQSGLFHTCAKYRLLFAASSLRAAITDRELTAFSAG